MKTYTLEQKLDIIIETLKKINTKLEQEATTALEILKTTKKTNN